YLGSLNKELLTSLATHLVRRGEFRLGRQLCVLERVDVEMPPVMKEVMRLQMLSPVTVYSTLYDRAGRRKTYYYSPFEEEFSEHIIQNLKRKAVTWYGPDVSLPEEAWIRPIRVKQADQKILRFKGTVIKGWMGLYEARLPEPYFTLAYYAGLGAKNSQGFGMIRVVGTGGYE
ncbi:MAG: CRISPR-associated endoribonuclease Cas6, partial [Candidatus Hydrothermae bacterium]|nr:CRISPR-associated endoribonuclease Cas6 [Candidatus Hydrothermae bacterium]